MERQKLRQKEMTIEINSASIRKGLGRRERARHITSLRGAKEIKQFLMLLFLSNSRVANGTLLADIKVAVSLLIDDSGVSLRNVITSLAGGRN